MRLHSHSLPHSTVSFLSVFLCGLPVELTVEGGGGGDGRGGESYDRWALYKSFKTLCCIPFALSAVPRPLFLQFQLLYYPYLQHSPPLFFYPFNFKLLLSTLPRPPAIPLEAEFLDVFGAKKKSYRVFILAMNSHLY